MATLIGLVVRLPQRFGWHRHVRTDMSDCQSADSCTARWSTTSYQVVKEVNDYVVAERPLSAAPAGILIARHGTQPTGAKKQYAQSAAARAPTAEAGQCCSMPGWKLAHVGCQLAGCGAVGAAVALAWIHFSGVTAGVADDMMRSGHRSLGVALLVLLALQVRPIAAKALLPPD